MAIVSLICATAVASTSFSWVSSFLIDSISVASARLCVMGVAWLIVVPLLGVEVFAVCVELATVVVVCVRSDDVSES